MADQIDVGTCDQILRLIVERGPITSGELAKILVLTPAAVRRHIATLAAEKYIQTLDASNSAPARRGRPSRRYVATPAGQEQLGQAYSDLATEALDFVKKNLGDDGLQRFIETRTATVEERYRVQLENSGASIAEKTEALAQALNKDGFVTTRRHGGPNTLAIQLCQGHCPVLQVAESFPEICKAETEAFARLLGVPIQRLSTMPTGAHVCTTNIPLGIPQNLRTRVSSHSSTPLSQGREREGNQ